MLQKRYEEICDYEPDYRKCTIQALKKQCTKTTQYGMIVSHSSIKEYKLLLQYTVRLFQFMKLGLYLPPEDKMRETLIHYRRYSKLDPNDPLHPKCKKSNSINNSESLETPQDV